MKHFFICCFFFLSINFIFSQNKDYIEKIPNLKDTLYNYKFKLHDFISDDWYIQVNDSSLTLIYCRTCKEKAEEYNDSLFREYLKLNPWLKDIGPDKSNEPLYGVSHSYTLPKSIPSIILMDTMYKRYGPDSVSVNPYNSRKGNAPISERREFYKPDQELKIEVLFRKKWTEKEIKLIQKKNDNLKKKLETNTPAKTITSFEDYRAFVPQTYLKKIIEDFDYYFERLPYKSGLTKYSVFVIPNSEELHQEYTLFDKDDFYYFHKESNNLDKIRKETFIIIGYVLQLEDYKYIGQ